MGSYRIFNPTPRWCNGNIRNAADTTENAVLRRDYAVFLGCRGMNVIFDADLEKRFVLRHSGGALLIFRTRIGSAGNFNANPDNGRKFQRPRGNLGEQWGNRIGRHDQQQWRDANRGFLS